MKCYSLRIPILGKGRKSNIHSGCLYVRCEPNGLILIRTSVLVRTKVLTLPPPKKKIQLSAENSVSFGKKFWGVGLLWVAFMEVHYLVDSVFEVCPGLPRWVCIPFIPVSHEPSFILDSVSFRLSTIHYVQDLPFFVFVFTVIGKYDRWLWIWVLTWIRVRRC